MALGATINGLGVGVGHSTFDWVGISSTEHQNGSLMNFFFSFKRKVELNSGTENFQHFEGLRTEICAAELKIPEIPNLGC